MKTLRLKVKPDSYAWLNAAAREVNFVWNWAAETSERAVRRYIGPAKWLSGYDLCRLSTGASAHFSHIGADIIQRIACEYATKRVAAKTVRLSWRRSGGNRRSLGWVPFKSNNLKRKAKSFRIGGKAIRVFEFNRTLGLKLKDGQFAQDATGDWWLCLPVDAPDTNDPAPLEEIGIDLGLKDVATTSDGVRLRAGRWTHGLAGRLANAQRRAHRKQAKRIHRKIARQRQDALHKFTTSIVKQYQYIAIGDVSSSKLAQTNMAKSVLDSGWAMLKTQLQYKGQRAGRSVQVVDESYTSRACSACGSLSGPRGVNGLRVREWTCCDCGASHDRDVNAARNILARAKMLASVCGNESKPGRKTKVKA